MADPKSPLDELNSALDGLDSSEATPEVGTSESAAPSKQDNEDSVQGVEIGGRVWTSREDLDKAWRDLDNSVKYHQSNHSKSQKALADRDTEFKKYQEEHREAVEMAQYFKNNPEVHEKVREFWKKITSGQETPTQAIKSSGLNKEDPEFKKLLEWKASVESERQEALVQAADRELDVEIEALKKEYKLDNEKLGQVLQAAGKFNKNLDSTDDWVPLKDVYLMLSSKHAWRKAANVKDTALPSPRSETIVPSSSPKSKTPEDELLSSLDKMGI